MKGRAQAIAGGVFAALAVALAACSGGFDSGGSGMPMGMPPGPQFSTMPQAGQGEYPGAGPTSSPLPESSPQAYALADASKGLTCPPMPEGYACTIRLNVPAPSPAPSGSPKATPTPSPTPSPESTSDDEDTPSPSPSPNGPTLTLKSEALPQDAPKMAHVPLNAQNVVPLMMISMTPSDSYTLKDRAIAQFTLPKTQFINRGFALQIFSSTMQGRKQNFAPLASTDKFRIDEQTLTFGFVPPRAMTIPRGGTYVLVLYGDNQPQNTPSPSPSPSSSASPAASASPSAAPSSSASPAPSAT